MGRLNGEAVCGRNADPAQAELVEVIGLTFIWVVPAVTLIPLRLSLSKPQVV
ncbi:MAG: hypothetical protein RLZZ597_530 [Cyanobacteriota bacterium]|jgi:hypothetical protein